MTDGKSAAAMEDAEDRAAELAKRFAEERARVNANARASGESVRRIFGPARERIAAQRASTSTMATQARGRT